MDYKNIYILGIGGSGMSSIGKYLKQKGLNVIGYDQRKSYITNLLKQDGIDVVFSEFDIPYDKNNLYRSSPLATTNIVSITSIKNKYSFYTNN